MTFLHYDPFPNWGTGSLSDGRPGCSTCTSANYGPVPTAYVMTNYGSTRASDGPTQGGIAALVKICACSQRSGDYQSN